MRLKVLHSKIHKFVFSRGFTLIEFIVVLSIIAILSTLGIVAFVNYSRIQALNAAASDVATILQTAKSRAQSQVKPTSGVCSGPSAPALTGYKVVVCPGGCPAGATEYVYKLDAVCDSSSQTIEEKKLPRGICFSGVCASVNRWPEESFFFPILTGGAVVAVDGVPGSVRILINHRDFKTNSRAKNIRVYSDGRIVSQ